MNTTTKHPILAIRRAGVPLCAFETADPAATVRDCIKALNSKADDYAVMQWDVIRGIYPTEFEGFKSKKGEKAVKDMGATPLETSKPTSALDMLATDDKVPEQTICFFANAHRFITNEAVAQAIWNIRDKWKSRGSILIMLCPQMTLPVELSHDVVVVTEPLPDIEQVTGIVDTICDAANVKQIENKPKVIDTLLGVSAFAAEQVLAMSISKEGGTATIDHDALWERKRKMVEQTPGLSVWRGKGTFDELGGLANIKDYLKSLLTSGRNPVRCIGFIDEIEKLFAGAAGDLSGVSQDQLQVFLTQMQDNDIPGMILIGPPGTGKSAIAKAAGSVAEAEVLSIDTGAMTGSLVGESQAKIRKAMSTFKAVSQGKGMFIATCNKITSLPPELRRRFTLGTFFFDLPDKTEREAIWKIWTGKYFGTDKAMLKVAGERPKDDDWTPAEIRACCDVSYRTGKSLVEASRFIVPVAVGAADQIKQLREMADGRFISASKPGLYEYNKPTQSTGRRMVD